MNCPWRRTLASVFLLLSSHNVRVISQNVVPTGPLPLLPYRGLTKDCAGMNSGPGIQQNNLMPCPSNGVLQEIVPASPFAVEYQKTPEYFGPVYPQVLQPNSAPHKNQGSFPLVPGFNIPLRNNLQLQGPLNNALPNTNIPSTQEPLFNTIPSSLAPPGSSFNIPSVVNIPPLQRPSPNISPIPFAPILQGPSFTEVPTSPFTQGLQYNISPVPLATNSLGQILPCSQIPETPNPRPVCNIAPNVENQNMQPFPLRPTSYPQPFVRPVGTPSTLPTDLISVGFLPTPNLPTAIPLQNSCTVHQSSIQPAVYSQSTVPQFQLPISPISPNYQISALPTVTPQSCDNLGRNFQTVTDEFSPVPINLQINVPSPTIPEPKITIITAYPSAPALPAPATTSDSSDVLRSFGTYPPPPYSLPPIIIEGRRSQSRSWLPLFLIALFARDGYCGSGGCCCCCPCNYPSSDVPIPYPIPIPTNNPIIVGCAKRARKTGSKAKSLDKKND